MEYTFDKQTGAFFFIRDLTSGFPRYPDKPHPLTYIVAGALPWNKLSDDVAGSPDLNKVTAEPREKGGQPETLVDKPTQDAIFRATLQAIPPNA
jgi:hypothetical protein